jgi:hypothetical protein
MKCVLCCEGSDFPTLPEEIKKYEEAAAKAAREQVLDILFKDRVKQGGRTDGFEFYIIGVKTVESLRAHQQEQQAGVSE